MSDGPCPCGSGQGYERCCGPIHASGAGLGITAEALMRARYCAYVRGDATFLTTSWHPDTRPASVEPDPGIEWRGLEIIETEAGSGLDGDGIVEFRARYDLDGTATALHERSTFTRLDGQWVYVDGTTPRA